MAVQDASRESSEAADAASITENKWIENVLRKYAELPTYDSAEILSGPQADRVELLLTSHVWDMVREAQRNIKKYISFRPKGDGTVEDLVEWSYEDSDDVVLSAAHEHVPGERVVFRSRASDKGDDKKKIFVERWSRTELLSCVEVTKLHGPVYNDSIFAAVAFHPSRPSRIAYIAEEKKPELKTWKKFQHKDDFGEKLDEKSDPTVVVLDFEGGLSSDGKSSTDADDTADKVVVMQKPDDVACGEVSFIKGGDQVLWMAMKTTPRRYGPVYCNNRRTSLRCSAYDGSECRVLTGVYDHARSPKVGEDGHVYFLTNRLSGPHMTCAALHRLDLQDLSTSVVLDVARHPSPGEFAGIYGHGFVMLGNHIAFAEQIRSTTRVQSADVSGKATNVVPKDVVGTARPGEESWNILGHGKNQMVVMRHDPKNELEICHFNFDNQKLNTVIQDHGSTGRNVDVKIIQYPDRDYLESILYLPSSSAADTRIKGEGGKPPVLISGHGGPSSAFSTVFSRWRSAMLELGIAMLEVNYTGSTGFGQDSIDKLDGHAGEFDVEDVQFARDELAKSGLVDANKIGVYGGSHGGFLGAWLVGRYPDSYDSAILMNPVTNFGEEVPTTDMPDIISSQARVEYNLDSPPLLNPKSYEKLWKGSPISVADKVKAPVLMILGGKDRRVPPHQGITYIQYLRGNGHKDARCLMFSDCNHGLGTYEAFKHAFIAMVSFLAERWANHG